jgi:hypothetical protein
MLIYSFLPKMQTILSSKRSKLSVIGQKKPFDALAGFTTNMDQ